MTYRERRGPVPGSVLWERTADAAPLATPITPDGCMDLLWDGKRLFVAGPDTSVRWHCSPPGTGYVALRFFAGVGASLLGVAAHEVRDTRADLEELWPTRRASQLAERVGSNPRSALTAWVVEAAAAADLDPFGLHVWSMATAGTRVTTMAELLGMSPRQLQRRCLPIFGYGARHLTRVIRFGRAQQAIRAGGSLAQVAASCGYADQAHLTREVRSFAGTTPADLRASYGGSSANRSTGRPSGSKTTA